jgi:hypothetical protein
MSLTYNLKFKKFNYTGKQVSDKEGEAHLYEDRILLKGKGGSDRGQFIKMDDLQEIFIKNDTILLSTTAKEKFQITDLKLMHEDFVTSFMKVRNKYLLHALLLEKGDFVGEFDVNFTYISKFDRTICRGKGKIRVYEKSIVIIPETREAFGLSFDFLSGQEIDDINYEIKLLLDDGKKLIIKNLHSMFEDFVDILDRQREKMYQQILESLTNQLPEYEVTKILKVAALIKGGKATPIKKIEKIDAQLFADFQKTILTNENAQQVYKSLLSLTDEDHTYFGFKEKQNLNEDRLEYFAWTLHSIPQKNVIALSITSREQINTHFFQIIIEHGDPYEKDKDRIQEINEVMIHFNFDTGIFSRDKKELRRHNFSLALAKISALRSLRKSYLGRIHFRNLEDWQKNLQLTFTRSNRQTKPPEKIAKPPFTQKPTTFNKEKPPIQKISNPENQTKEIKPKKIDPEVKKELKIEDPKIEIKKTSEKVEKENTSKTLKKQTTEKAVKSTKKETLKKESKKTDSKVKQTKSSIAEKSEKKTKAKTAKTPAKKTIEKSNTK